MISALKILLFLACLAIAYAQSPPVECGAIDCPNTYQPICTTDRFGKRMTFPNECLWNVYNCFNEDNPMVRPVSGECSSVLLCENVQYLQHLIWLAQQPHYC